MHALRWLLGLALVCAVTLPAAASGSPPSADLSVAVSHLPGTVNAHDVVTFTITVTNHGPDAATGVIAVLQPPPGEFVSFPQPCAPPDPALRCSLGTLGSGASTSFTYALRVRPDSVTTTVSVSSSVADPLPQNDQATETFWAERQTELNVGISGSPDPALTGEAISYAAVITNGGPDDAYESPNGDGVQVRFDLPDGLTIVSVSPTCTSSYAVDGHVLCRFSALTLDRSVAATVAVRAETPGPVAVSATVSSGGFSSDPDPSNNAATAQTTVLSGYSLSVARAGAGEGVVVSNPAGIDCGSTCSTVFAAGSQVTLTASAAAGSQFTGWGGDCAGTQATCSLTLDQARSASAAFDRKPPPPPPPPEPPPPAPPPPPPPPPSPTPPPPVCVVPKVVGKTLHTARSALMGAHCTVGRTSQRYSRIRKGLVLSQQPAPGKMLQAGGRVDLVLSRGRRPR
jgi:uncharacterized repeat protein (TIGR01451 family)